MYRQIGTFFTNTTSFNNAQPARDFWWKDSLNTFFIWVRQTSFILLSLCTHGKCFTKLCLYYPPPIAIALAMASGRQNELGTRSTVLLLLPWMFKFTLNCLDLFFFNWGKPIFTHRRSRTHPSNSILRF